MLRRVTVALLMLALAATTMGQESCGSTTGSDETTASDTTSAEREAARERKREKRRAKKRREREKRRREAQRTPPPLPETVPETEPPTQPERQECHPSYKGDCLDPDASDYDCAGGSGDGPEYANGPITVTGDDPYDLDRDGDGTACET